MVEVGLRAVPGVRAGGYAVPRSGRQPSSAAILDEERIS